MFLVIFACIFDIELYFPTHKRLMSSSHPLWHLEGEIRTRPLSSVLPKLGLSALNLAEPHKNLYSFHFYYVILKHLIFTSSCFKFPALLFHSCYLLPKFSYLPLSLVHHSPNHDVWILHRCSPQTLLSTPFSGLLLLNHDV